MKQTLFSEKALTEKAKTYVAILKEDGATKKELESTEWDFKVGYNTCKEDLRELLEGASPLLKPQVGTTIARYNHKQGYNHLKRELLAELEKEEKVRR